jgi:hypothetical protein
VNPDLPQERVDRMWRAIAAPRPRSGAPRITFALAAVAGIVAAGAGLYRAHEGAVGGPPLLARGDVVDSPSGSTLTLPDGSSLTVGQTTKLSVADASPSRVRLELSRGTVTCDVTHVEGRSFEVAVGDFEVRVRGTRFAVTAREGRLPGQQPSVEVRVERGRVEVARDHDADGPLIASLGPGQSWSQVDIEAIAPAPPAPGATEAPPPAPGPPAGAGAHRAGRPHVAPPARDVETAVDLLRRANEARVATRLGEAAGLYDRLREEYPEDARAGLASFELARIRLENLSDAQGALEALRFAKVNGHGGFAADDAEAMEIDALDRLGQGAECRRARDAFVARRASSPHLARVLRACNE